MNGSVEIVGVSEGLGGQMTGFEIAPDGLDVVELGGVLGQPFDDEPMGVGGKCGGGGLPMWLGPLSSTMTPGLIGRPGRWP